MDDDRKYRQRGYMDSDREPETAGPWTRPKPSGPRPPIDVTGPRLPRLLQNVVAARCFNCSTTLCRRTSIGRASVPSAARDLHCCKQCAHFEPSTRFQCLKPIPAADCGEGSGQRMRAVQPARHRGSRRGPSEQSPFAPQVQRRALPTTPAPPSIVSSRSQSKFRHRCEPRTVIVQEEIQRLGEISPSDPSASPPHPGNRAATEIRWSETLPAAFAGWSVR